VDKPESLGQFLVWKPPYIKTLIGSNILIPQGKLILCGAKKSWKSMTAMDMAFCLSAGRPWFGLPTTKSTVLVVQSEIPKFAYQDRIKKYYFNHEGQPLDNLYFITARNLKIDKPWGRDTLKAWIDMTQAQVVVIDPAYKAISGHLVDEYDVGRFTDTIDEIIDEKKVAFIIVHHESKTTFTEGMAIDRGADASYGSVRFEWWTDSQINLKAHSEGSNIVDISFPLLRLAINEIPSFTFEVNRDTLKFNMEVKEVQHEPNTQEPGPNTQGNGQTELG